MPTNTESAEQKSTLRVSQETLSEERYVTGVPNSDNGSVEDARGSRHLLDYQQLIRSQARCASSFCGPRGSELNLAEEGHRQTETDILRSSNLVLVSRGRAIWTSCYRLDLPKKLLDGIEIPDLAVLDSRTVEKADVMQSLSAALKEHGLAEGMREYLMVHFNQGALYSINVYYKNYLANLLSIRPAEDSAIIACRPHVVRQCEIVSANKIRFTSCSYYMKPVSANVLEKEPALLARTSVTIADEGGVPSVVDCQTDEAESLPGLFLDPLAAELTVYNRIASSPEKYDKEIRCLMQSVKEIESCIKEKRQQMSNSSRLRVNRQRKVIALQEIRSKTKRYIVHKAMKSPVGVVKSAKQDVKKAITNNVRVLSAHVNILKRLWNAIVGFAKVKFDGSRHSRFSIFTPAATRSTCIAQSIADASIGSPVAG